MFSRSTSGTDSEHKARLLLEWKNLERWKVLAAVQPLKFLNPEICLSLLMCAFCWAAQCRGSWSCCLLLHVHLLSSCRTLVAQASKLALMDMHD